MQSAEWASLHFISFTRFYLSLIDFVVWMRYDAKGKISDRTLLEVNELGNFLLCYVGWQNTKSTKIYG